MRLLLAALVLCAVTGCTVRRSVLTTLPTAPTMAAPSGRGDVSVTGTAATFVEPAQDPSEIHLWVPRGQLEAAGTIRVARWFGMRPTVGLGFAQGALLERGGVGPDYGGDAPAITFGPGFLFRIEPDERLDIDIEIDPLLTLVLETTERCGSTTCSAVDEDYVMAFGGRAAVTLGYEVTDFAGVHLGLALASHPTSAESFGDPVPVPIVRGGGFLSVADYLDLTLDVQWPFVNAPGVFGPTISLGLRTSFGSLDEPTEPEVVAQR